MIFTRDQMIQRCNRRIAEIFGYRGADELVGKAVSMLYPDAQSYERVGREAGPLLAAGQAFQAKLRALRSDGMPIWCRIYGRAVDPARTDQGTVWIVEDITEAVHTEEALQETLRQMAAIMDNAPVGIFFTVDRRLTRYNQKCADMVGIRGDDAIGVPARAFYRSDEEYEALGRVAQPLLAKGKPFQTQMYLRHRNGTDVWANIIAYIQNPRNTAEATIWMIEDRSQQKLAEERARFLATHDTLTSLPNRALFDEMLGRAIEAARRYARCFALLFIDLDGFKAVNDTLGHDAGDALLKEIGARLVRCVRAGDIVARYGGDEFVVLVQEVSEAGQVATVAGKILAAASQPAVVTGKECLVSASIGISLYPSDAPDAQALLKSADAAMYVAKQRGKNNYQFYSPSVSREVTP
jgi:diguanylate cyclase (GGDEF)-like protein/PAS domain S-box-containing protein